MPTVVTDRPYRPVPLDPPRKRWTRAECAALETSGVWAQQKLELVDGELRVQLREPLKGVAPGQAVAIYREDGAGDIVLASATIDATS